jgi:hypothetical protein
LVSPFKENFGFCRISPFGGDIVMELTEIDFKILETAASFNAFQIESILSSLPDDKYNKNHTQKLSRS